MTNSRSADPQRSSNISPIAGPGAATLFAADLRQRAVERRMVREADDYVQSLVSRGGKAILFTPPEKRSAGRRSPPSGAIWRTELARWEDARCGGRLSVDLLVGRRFHALYPMIALFQRMDMRHPEFGAASLFGPRLTGLGRAAWPALPATQKTWPPHWKGPEGAGDARRHRAAYRGSCASAAYTAAADEAALRLLRSLSPLKAMHAAMPLQRDDGAA